MTNRKSGPGIAGALPYIKAVDLSHPVSPQMPRWPGDPPTEFHPWADQSRDGYYLRRFAMSEHGGTHLTAPASYYPRGQTADRYLAADLVKPAIIIDARPQCQSNPDYALTAADVQAWESCHGPLPPGALTLLLTGWSEHWHNPAKYLGADPAGGLHFPGFSPDAADLLLNHRHAAGLGTDTAGPEPGADTTYAVSRLTLSQPRILLENLTNLHLLPPTGATLVIGLLKLSRGSGAPAAVTAFLP